MIQKILGFKIPVIVFTKTGGGYKTVKDLGKYKTTKGGTRKFELWKHKLSLPTPPPEAVINDTVYIYSEKRGVYDYVTFDPKEKQFEVIDTDMTHWAEQEIKEGFSKYEDQSFLGKYAPYIMMGIFLFLCVLAMVVYFQQVISPMIEQARNVASTTCICEVADGVARSVQPPA